ncbi:major tail protein [Paenibacillus oryzisoli]|uniref:SbsA Ig-like domain-containing protein n=1 Tax=Paenibacillus oryzisoli TaxID=1850517 RepID=A0A198AJ86_9BACL|nr:major tail protein [Paenibacillus oryzisoli]OAS21135.1 hypothetical protein A8708_30050 [Paenibacillus oryzisoli]
MGGIRIGMDMLYYAKMVDEENETYGTPVRIPGAVTATVTPTTNSETFYADDKADEVATSLGDISIDINPKDLPRDILADILGATVDSNGVIVQASTDVAPYVAIGWRSRKSNGKYRYFWYYKGKFQPNEEEFQTKEDTPTFQTPTITGLFIPRNIDSAWRVRVDEDDSGVSPTTITNWFTSVYEETPDVTPPTLLSIVPANGWTTASATANIVATFSEELRASTVNGSNFLLISGVTPVPAVVTLDPTLEIVTINPVSNLTATTTYSVIISTAVEDMAGNNFQTASVTTFRTT